MLDGKITWRCSESSQGFNCNASCCTSGDKIGSSYEVNIKKEHNHAPRQHREISEQECRMASVNIDILDDESTLANTSTLANVKNEDFSF